MENPSNFKEDLFHTVHDQFLTSILTFFKQTFALKDENNISDKVV